MLNNWEITLVKYNNKPISLGVGKYCYAIVNNKLEEDECARNGSAFNGKLEEYEQALELAHFAWNNQLFDKIENH